MPGHDAISAADQCRDRVPIARSRQASWRGPLSSRSSQRLRKEGASAPCRPRLTPPRGAPRQRSEVPRVGPKGLDIRSREREPICNLPRRFPHHEPDDAAHPAPRLRMPVRPSRLFPQRRLPPLQDAPRLRPGACTASPTGSGGGAGFLARDAGCGRRLRGAARCLPALRQPPHAGWLQLARADRRVPDPVPGLPPRTDGARRRVGRQRLALGQGGGGQASGHRPAVRFATASELQGLGRHRAWRDVRPASLD